MNIARKPTVLMVEDEESLRLPVAEILRRRGFNVIECPDGISALDRFRNKAHEIDVVFLDMTLPSMSGADVLREVLLIRPDAKVVLTSAYAWESVVDRLNGGHASAFIRKPYSPSELAMLLSEAAQPASARYQAG